MKRYHLYQLLLFILFGFQVVHAQESPVGNWISLNPQLNFSKRFSMQNDFQIRHFKPFSDYEQTLLRTLFTYSLVPDKVYISAGAAFSHQASYNQVTGLKKSVDERRLHQQLALKQQVGRFYLQHRYRIEQRFFYERFILRWRYQFSVQVPLNHRQIEKKTVYIGLNNEVFLNNKPPTFDRNRFQAGIGYYFNPGFRAEAAYMWQMYESDYRPQFVFTIFKSVNLYKE
jgi:hypothetical protein